LQQTLEFLLRHGYWVLFVWVLAEQLGTPVPSVPILLAMGALIGTGLGSFASAIWLVFVAALSADSTWYLLGRRKGHSVLRFLCRISIEPDSCVSSTRAWFKRLGGWALVVAKFVPGLGTVAAPMSGLERMPWWKFLAADGLGILLWAGAYLGIGCLFREQLEDVGRLAARMGGGLIAIVIALLALWLGWKFWQRKRFIRSLRIARITPQELMDRLADFVVVDLRSASEIDWDGMQIRGALWFDRKELALHQHLIPRDRDVVLYCT
jgi:membrane protein DedA with SNARE-associated domain